MVISPLIQRSSTRRRLKSPTIELTRQLSYTDRWLRRLNGNWLTDCLPDRTQEILIRIPRSWCPDLIINSHPSPAVKVFLPISIRIFKSGTFKTLWDTTSSNNNWIKQAALLPSPVAAGWLLCLGHISYNQWGDENYTHSKGKSERERKTVLFGTFITYAGF